MSEIPKIERRKTSTSTYATSKNVAPPSPGWPACEEFGDYYVITFLMPPKQRIDVIREGLPSAAVARLSKDMAVPKDSLIRWLGLSRATVNRKDRQHEALSQYESERVLGIGSLIGQVQTMVRESGTCEGFDAAKWVSQWLSEPLPALNGERPVNYLDTIEGQKLVSGLLAMTQTGAYA